MQSILIIGFGIMGRVSGALLKEKGFNVRAFDAYPQALEKARDMGIEPVASLSEGAAACDLAILFLPGPEQIEACVTGADGLLAGAKTGFIIIDMATSSPQCTEKVAAVAAAGGVGYIDAPVLGRPSKVGQWALPVGGEIAHLEKVRPALEVLASNIMHLGPSGSGHKVKLLNQMMFGAINAMTAEMMAVAEKVGVDPGLLYETITSSKAGTVSNLFLELGARVRDNDYADPTFSVDMLAKDVRLGLEMAKANGASPILGRVVDFINESARGKGQGSLDTACMWQSVRGFWK